MGRQEVGQARHNCVISGDALARLSSLSPCFGITTCRMVGSATRTAAHAGDLALDRRAILPSVISARRVT